MAAPPRARQGEVATLTGRPIIAGVAPFARSLSIRATTSDLWASLDALTANPSRLETLHSHKLSIAAKKRFAAYVSQAREYHGALAGIEPAAKPLVAYYFALNLTKAFLTSVEPSTTGGRLGHGVRPDVEKKKRYRIAQEGFQVGGAGVLRLLAERKGQRFCWSSGYRIQLIKAMEYLPEAFDLYRDAYGKTPRLLPIVDTYVLFGRVEGQKAAWLRVEADRNVLRERRVGPERLMKEARALGDRYRLVADAARETASYESTEFFPYGKKRSEILTKVCQLLDETIIGVQRYRSGSPKFLVLNVRPQLLSHEAMVFAVLHHLSDMVRYRPEIVELLRGSKHFWLFASWVDRACENFLLALAGRITQEEHGFG